MLPVTPLLAAAAATITAATTIMAVIMAVDIPAVITTHPTRLTAIVIRNIAIQAIATATQPHTGRQQVTTPTQAIAAATTRGHIMAAHIIAVHRSI